MRPRLVIALLALAAVGAVLLSVPALRSRVPRVRSAAPAVTWVAPPFILAAQKAPPPPTLGVPDTPVTIPAGLTEAGWSLVDTGTGTVVGHSANASTMVNYTESMIKAWIAADFLGRAARAGTMPAPGDLAQLQSMIIHSDDNIAARYYRLGGGDAELGRLDQVCGLHSGTAMPGWWSYTRMSPDDAARYGLCLANGTAAGRYTAELLGWMRAVTGGVADQAPDGNSGGGHWGIVDGLPPSLAGQASIKNGWEPEVQGHVWHVNCLAILPTRVLVVMVRYPWVAPDDDWHHATNLGTGAAACGAIAAQLVVTPDL